jgi:ferrochelatase
VSVPETPEKKARFWPEPVPNRLHVWPESFKIGRVGVLFVNLGTPDEPTAPAIRRYLREFLSDPRVIEIPKLLWWPILNGPILTFRPRKLVHRYAGIWMEEGSPLMVYTKRQAAGVERLLKTRGHDVAVAVAMRYGKPSIRQGLLDLQAQGCEHVLTLPLYPQYASSTTGTVVDEVTRRFRRRASLRCLRW